MNTSILHSFSTHNIHLFFAFKSTLFFKHFWIFQISIADVQQVRDFSTRKRRSRASSWVRLIFHQTHPIHLTWLSAELSDWSVSTNNSPPLLPLFSDFPLYALSTCSCLFTFVLPHFITVSQTKLHGFLKNDSIWGGFTMPSNTLWGLAIIGQHNCTQNVYPSFCSHFGSLSQLWIAIFLEVTRPLCSSIFRNLACSFKRKEIQLLMTFCYDWTFRFKKKKKKKLDQSHLISRQVRHIRTTWNLVKTLVKQFETSSNWIFVLFCFFSGDLFSSGATGTKLSGAVNLWTRFSASFGQNLVKLQSSARCVSSAGRFDFYNMIYDLYSLPWWSFWQVQKVVQKYFYRFLRDKQYFFL